MKLAFDIARRYLYAKKSQNIINIISMISVFGVLTGSMALVIVLSVFNGVHGLMGDLYTAFDPDLKVVPLTGKVISTDSIPYEDIKQTEGVLSISEVLEHQALLRFRQRKIPGMIMGVDTMFNKVSSIDSIMIDGKYELKYKSEFRGVIGKRLADQLAIRLNFVTPLTMYVPKRLGNVNMMAPQNAFRQEYLSPSGFFAVNQEEYDGQYLIVDIEQARRLLQYDDKTISSLAIKVDDNADIAKVEKAIQALAGEQMNVLNQQEQHEAFYKVMKVEKLMAYIILSFIIAIAAFNIVANLAMLIYEKKESIFTLKSMGANKRLITRIFMTEGWLISVAGIIIGSLLGIVIVLVQEHFGIIKFSGSGNYITDAYPVVLQWTDVVLVIITVSIISALAAWYPVRVIVGRYYAESASE
ncbi:FtsX-like permease family protein [Carboxylicivirga sediminis]|uniref:FtsX-like permease family protein n=1 Tax=Carboxylicivirga sediminis TaxID=2006564 RepID=A0A941F3E6_9BACT|nr:FtsX-like permease family protein [Carboxylicivirga sediminis]MBR8535599.1 FtsX-like permease family protein [Carboxylicivirga sediminis]